MNNSLNLDAIVNHYLIGLLFAETDPSDQPWDDNYSTEDFTEEATAAAQADCKEFLAKCDTLALDLTNIAFSDDSVASSEERIGHDLALTRNGHGAGFWDRGLGELGQRLTDLCSQMGSVYIFSNDNKTLELERG